MFSEVTFQPAQPPVVSSWDGGWKIGVTLFHRCSFNSLICTKSITGKYDYLNEEQA